MAEICENPIEITLDDLRVMAINAGGIDAVYMHWSAGHYDSKWADYHINIDEQGRLWKTCDNLWEKLSHTWHRNTGSIGITMDCCAGAEANNGYDADFGDEPPTQAQIEMMARAMQVISDHAGIPIENMKSHCEMAFEDGYGPGSGDPQTRWDLWYLPDNAKGGEMVPGGQLLRDKAAWYSRNNPI